jgi:hypothetical protein
VSSDRLSLFLGAKCPVLRHLEKFERSVLPREKVVKNLISATTLS